MCGPSIAKDILTGYFQNVIVRGTSAIKLIILKITPYNTPYVYKLSYVPNYRIASWQSTMTHKLTYMYKNSEFLFLFDALNFLPG
jgi:hypothetical protein